MNTLDFDDSLVFPATVGIFTDCNGRKLSVGDIVRLNYNINEDVCRFVGSVFRVVAFDFVIRLCYIRFANNGYKLFSVSDTSVLFKIRGSQKK